MNLLNLWRTRNLTLYGRITILKSHALSKLVYNTSVLTFPLQFAASVKTTIPEFVWNTKPKIRHHNDWSENQGWLRPTPFRNND